MENAHVHTVEELLEQLDVVPSVGHSEQRVEELRQKHGWNGVSAKFILVSTLLTCTLVNLVIIIVERVLK